MNYSIPSHLQEFIHSQLSAGLFHNEQEIIDAALNKLREDLQHEGAQLVSLKAEINKGLDDIKNGNVSTSEEFEAEFNSFSASWHNNKKNDQL